MQIGVDGYRSSKEDWIRAHQVPVDDLPQITDEESLVAGKFGMSEEEYKRSQYALELSLVALKQRTGIVGELVTDWLQKNRVRGEVAAVWLKTLEGKFRIEVTTLRGTIPIFIREEVIDDLLEGGSLVAKDAIDRLLAANLATLIEKRAS